MYCTIYLIIWFYAILKWRRDRTQTPMFGILVFGNPVDVRYASQPVIYLPYPPGKTNISIFFKAQLWVDDFPSYINWCKSPRPEVHSVDPQVHGTFFVWVERIRGNAIRWGSVGMMEVSIRIARSFCWNLTKYVFNGSLSFGCPRISRV